MTDSVRASSSIVHTMLVGAAVVAGWTAYELAMVAWSGALYLAPTLLPGYAIAIALGAVVAVLCGRDRRLLGALVAVVGLAAVGFKLVWPTAPWHLLCLPRALCLLALALAAAMEILRARRPAGWAAFGLGALAAGLFSLLHSRHIIPVATFTLIAAPLLVAAATWRGARVRRAAVAAVLLVAASLAAVTAEQRGGVKRPDRPRAGIIAGDPAAPNLLLVVLDTVSAHHLAPYGYHRVTTPGIDAFAREHAVQYTQARSVSSWTLPTHASMFTGLYPSQHGADHPRAQEDGTPSESLGLFPADPLRSAVPTLAELLSERGYHTGAIVANNGYLNHVFGIDRGFDHYDDRDGMELQSLLLVQLAGAHQYLRKGPRRAETITDCALDWLDRPERGRPFFLFVNYMDAHGPYVPPPPFASAFESARPADPLEYDRSLYPLQYDRELSYLDAHVTRLIDGLRSRSLFRDTVVIVTSDHGEGFGTHGFWRHDLALYEELIAVPLYVKAAGDGQAGVSERPVTSPDLFHLMLEQLGLGDAAPAREAPIVAEWFQSEALTRSPVMRPDDGQPIDRDLLVWIDGGLKWIVSSRGDVKAYDLSADPFERAPAPLCTDQIEAARARAKTWWDGNPPLPPAERPASELDPAVIDRLRNLGYVH